MGEIRHCEEVVDPNSFQVERTTHRGEFNPPRRSGKIIGLIVVIIVMAVVGWMMWRKT